MFVSTNISNLIDKFQIYRAIWNNGNPPQDDERFAVGGCTRYINSVFEEKEYLLCI